LILNLYFYGIYKFRGFFKNMLNNLINYIDRGVSLKICGLLGQNIHYSKSPSLHNEYYKLKNYPLKYTIFDIKINEMSSFISSLRKNNILGLNVTIPYKEIIIKYLDEITYPANKINAVNTVLVSDKGLIGYNTDYSGFIKSLQINNLELNDGNALIIGAGGAAKAVYHALSDLNCKSIDVTNRNLEKAFIQFGDYCEIIPLSSLKDLSKYNIIINCTPLGGVNHLDSLPMEIESIKKGCIAYDLVYNPKETRFLNEAKEHGAIIINGESMLKYQAYEAANIWADYLYNQ
jgi:shikimate dehydrogenase